MKFLVSDYTTNEFTEAMYINTALNLADCQSTLWPTHISTYDIFDMVKPDIHITHQLKLSIDLLHYLKENPGCDLVINVTGLQQNNFNMMEQTLEEFGINPLMYFTNQYDNEIKSSKKNINIIPAGADVFLGTADTQYNIDYAVFVNDKHQISPVGDTYHFITVYPQLEDNADYFLPINQICNGFKNYKHVVLKYFNKVFPQLFFDAAIYNGSVLFDVENRTTLDKYLNNILGEGYHCDIKDIDSGNIKDKISQKHTCLHRTKSLLSQLPCQQYTNNLQKIIENMSI